MASEKDSIWESSVEELRRQIDYQHSEYEFYQKQATLFFRISLATLGVMIAIVSIFGRETVLGFGDYLLNFTLKEAASQINLSAILTELVVALLYLEFTGFILAFVKKLGSIPIYAFKASYPVRLKPGLTEYQARKLLHNKNTHSKPEIDKGRDLIHHLREAIIENERVVESTEEQLKSALEAARDSVILGFFSVLTLAALLEGQALFDLLILSITSLAAVGIASTEIPWQKYGQFFYPYWQNFLPLILVLVWAISNTTNWVPSLTGSHYLPVLALIIPVLSIWFSDLEQIRYTIAQAAGLLVVFFTGLFIHTNIQSGNQTDSATYVLSIATVFFVVLITNLLIIYNLILLHKDIKQSKWFKKNEKRLREFFPAHCSGESEPAEDYNNKNIRIYIQKHRRNNCPGHLMDCLAGSRWKPNTILNRHVRTYHQSIIFSRKRPNCPNGR